MPLTHPSRLPHPMPCPSPSQAGQQSPLAGKGHWAGAQALGSQLTLPSRQRQTWHRTVGEGKRSPLANSFPSYRQPRGQGQSRAGGLWWCPPGPAPPRHCPPSPQPQILSGEVRARRRGIPGWLRVWSWRKADAKEEGGHEGALRTKLEEAGGGGAAGPGVTVTGGAAGPLARVGAGCGRARQPLAGHGAVQAEAAVAGVPRREEVFLVARGIHAPGPRAAGGGG